MALLKEVTSLTITGVGSDIRTDYILINGVNLDETAKPRFSEKPYLIWWGESGDSAPSVSGVTKVKVTVSSDDGASAIATATSNAIGALDEFTTSVSSPVVTITNSNFGEVTASSYTVVTTGVGTSSPDSTPAATISTTTSGTGSFVSNVKYPENQRMYIIEGDKIAVLSELDSSGNNNTSARKKLKAIQEDLVEGLVLQYYAEPDSVTAITDSLDIDNALELAIVDYVKKCLYMDRAGTATDAGAMQASMAMSSKHERNFKEAIRRYSVRKKDKVGGSRVVKVPTLV